MEKYASQKKYIAARYIIDDDFKFQCAVRNRKSRALRSGIGWTIEAKSLEVPAVCPVLGIPIFYGGSRENVPSIDRIDTSKGYEEGNVRVVSNRANRLKSDMTYDECKKLLDNFHKVW